MRIMSECSHFYNKLCLSHCYFHFISITRFLCHNMTCLNRYFFTITHSILTIPNQSQSSLNLLIHSMHYRFYHFIILIIPLIIFFLFQNVFYDFQIRSDCGCNMETRWSVAIGFHNLIARVPYKAVASLLDEVEKIGERWLYDIPPNF